MAWPLLIGTDTIACLSDCIYTNSLSTRMALSLPSTRRAKAKAKRSAKARGPVKDAAAPTTAEMEAARREPRLSLEGLNRVI